MGFGGVGSLGFAVWGFVTVSGFPASDAKCSPSVSLGSPPPPRPHNKQLAGLRFVNLGLIGFGRLGFGLA